MVDKERQSTSSQIKVIFHDEISGDVYALDNRYGQERTGYNRDTALEMARLDNLIGAADVKPGDEIELLLKTWIDNPEKRIREEKHTWYELGDNTFRAIDNGRFMVNDKSEPGSYFAVFKIENILDVRKKQQHK